MAVAGDLVIGIRSNTRGLVSGLNQADSSLTRFGKSVLKAGIGMATFAASVAAAAGAGAIGGLTLLAKNSMESLDELAKLSRQLNITTADLAGFQLAAEESGSSSEAMVKALQQMVRRVSEAATGTGQASDALEELGISALWLNTMAPAEQFRTISKAISEQTNHANRLRIAYELFGRSGMDMINMLMMGEKGLDEAAQAAKDLGLAVDAIDIKSIEAANDAIGRMKSIFKGIGNQLAISIAPFVKYLADQFTEASKGAENFASIGRGIATAFAKVADVIHSLKIGMVEFLALLSGALAKLSTNKMSRWLHEQTAKAYTGKAAQMMLEERPSVKMQREWEQQEKTRQEANRRRELDIMKVQYETLAETFGVKAGEWIGKALNLVPSKMALGVEAITATAGNIFTGGAASRTGLNKAIDATTAEGFAALRANIGKDPQKELVDVNRKQLIALTKGNTLSQRVVDLLSKAGNMISIPAA